MALVNKEDDLTFALKTLYQIDKKIGDGTGLSNRDEALAWRGLLSEIYEDHRNYEYTIGVAGDTGLGKTTLLNALLGEKKDIAPSSQSAACTAAVTRFLSNELHGFEEPYVAKVRIKNLESVIQDLNLLFDELKNLEEKRSAEVPDEGEEREYKSLLSQFDLVQGWTGVDKASLQKYGRSGECEMIPSFCAQSKSLFNFKEPGKSRTITVASNQRKHFIAELKNYIGSFAKGKGIPLWPLVESADVFLCSDILKRGIVLVDLPGEMDANEARSRVAQECYHSLDNLMIITPSDRAADNRTAQDLMRNDQVLDLDANGKLEEGHVCIVVTRNDLLDWKTFVENEWSPEDISAEFPDIYTDFEEKTEALSKLEEEMEELRQESDDDDDDESGTAACSLATRRTEHAQLQSDVEALDQRCFQQCIAARSRFHQQQFQEHFNQVRQQCTEESQFVPVNLPVFPVSSTCQRDLLRGKPVRGFQNSTATGFDGLHQWIATSSRKRREEHLDALLHRCQILFDAVEGWFLDEFRPAAGVAAREVIEIKEALANLQKEVSKTARTRVGHLIGGVKHRSPFQAPRWKDTNVDLAKTLPQRVHSLSRATTGVPLHWCTYAACIRRRGGSFKTSSKLSKYLCWKDTLSWFFWSHHIRMWNMCFKQLGDKLTKAITNRLSEVVEHYKGTILNVGQFPEAYQAVFKARAYKLENLWRELIMSDLPNAVKKYESGVATVRRATREILNHQFQDAYVVACAITGKGKLANQCKHMEQYSSDNGFKIVDETTLVIIQGLNNATDDLKTVILNRLTIFTNAMKKEESLIIRLLTSKSQNESRHTAADTDLRTVAQPLLKEWVSVWDRLREQYPMLKGRVLTSQELEEPPAADAFTLGGEVPRKKRRSRKRKVPPAEDVSSQGQATDGKAVKAAKTVETAGTVKQEEKLE